MTGHTADIEWNPDGVPVSRVFDDPYYSLEDGLAESRHVFLAGNDLPGRFAPGFRIGELGFGTGLNLCAALQAWRLSGTPGRLRYTGFEAYPLSADEMETSLGVFPEIRDLAAPILKAWDAGKTRIVTDDLDAEVIIGDARENLPRWDGLADAWFLDGFAPARNPELWETQLLVEIALHTAPTGSCATYSAAGEVRRGLEAAGFEVARVPGFGRKRHMTIGRLV
ncbi:MAG: tRNA (5-methylaminomethyl-2-thiouridine)(34)-methyltransferase MnmD [Rhodobacteraceae bacterium]|nr:tRNA (5-methylaminomethyl-2-thiouridine)(34)-methyltransferase MnmD [Paracoccaceae bacterium]